jgi:RHS repeat-associated protein
LGPQHATARRAAGGRPHFDADPGLTGALETATEALLTAGGIDPVEATGTHGELPSVGFVFTISIPIPKPPPWLHFSFGANATPRRVSGFELGMQDIDGDGFADHVLKTSDEDFTARVNGLAGGNLLAGVDRPLHGSFEIAYERAGNTVDLPQSRWVVSTVTVKDARDATEPGHAITTAYTFDGGQYDRIEREFRGFRTVTRTNPDGTEVEQTFLVSDFRHKALLERETVRESKGGRVFVETANDYHDARLMEDADPECVARTPMFLRNANYCQPSFVGLRSTTRAQWEGGSGPPVRSRQSFDYDDLGNVTSFRDDGDLADADDDVHATVAYGPPAAAVLHCTGAPVEITVKGKKGEVLRRRKSVYDGRCNLTELSSLVAGSTWATSDLEWYDDGNLKAVTAPPNHRGQRYRVAYAYDGTVATYPVRTEDSHGYASEAEYDYRFGEPTLTRDVNRNETRRRLDDFGRVDRLAAPGATLASPTMAIAYHPEAVVSYALTQNRLPTGGTLDTVVVMDGLGRVIQTKKTAEIWTRDGEGTQVGWSVTGRQVLDAMGRVAEQHQTVFQGGSAAGYTETGDRNPTHLFYDALGRTVRTVEPDGAVSRIAYDLAAPQGSSIRRLRTTAVDAMGKVSVVYKDALGKTVATEEHVEGRTPTTTYAYDAVGQLTDVVDAAGNRTSVAYDLLGRRTRLDNPDAGLVELFYDLAGNLTRKVDANLRAHGQAIEYVYDFERPAEVHYPDARRNVTYAYGAPNAPENGAARVVRVTDEVGSEERGYDALGNVVRTKRTIEPLRPGDRVRTFETTFDFDVYGRMRSMVYPDGEVLKYGYDRGGLVQWARGERPATAHEAAQSETYLAKLLYDEFGQRVYQRVGNGVVTKYGYDEETRRLGTLHARKPGERLLQDLTYRYDLVGNVRALTNDLLEPDPSHAGRVDFTYEYDDLHRLTLAHAEAKSRPGTLDTFTSKFAYSDIHAMTSNVQVHQVKHGPTDGGEFPPQTNHDLTYTYGGTGPHQATRIGDTSLVYDGNGNTVRECRDPADATCTERPAHLRRLYWTEENRLDAVIDGGGRNVTKFYYDASGERIAKLGRGGESITVGQFWSVKGRRAAMKHVFVGAARVASKLLPPPGWDDVPRGLVDGTEPSTTTDETGCDPSNYSPQKCQYLPGGDPVLNDYYADAKVRPETYYYHPDHLGSTSWVTDQNARVHERVEYFPYGAAWRDTRSDIGASPVKGQRFLFTGKEIDEETGLYYFGARYLDPKTARWVSADPAIEVEEFLASSPRALSAYLPMFANPVRLVDPTGLAPEDANAGASGLSEFGGGMADALKSGAKGYANIVAGRAETFFGSMLEHGLNLPQAMFDVGMEEVLGLASGLVDAYKKGGLGAAGNALVPVGTLVTETRQAFAEGGGGNYRAAGQHTTKALGAAAIVATTLWGGAKSVGGLVKRGGAPTGGFLVRFGEAEGAEQLAARAAQAAGEGFPHGVSTKWVERITGSDKRNRWAPVSEVQKHFKVEQTGSKLWHHTVHLPNPVTAGVADLFNSIFRRR